MGDRGGLDGRGRAARKWGEKVEEEEEQEEEERARGREAGRGGGGGKVRRSGSGDEEVGMDMRNIVRRGASGVGDDSR